MCYCTCSKSPVTCFAVSSPGGVACNAQVRAGVLAVVLALASATRSVVCRFVRGAIARYNCSPKSVNLVIELRVYPYDPPCLLPFIHHHQHGLRYSALLRQGGLPRINFEFLRPEYASKLSLQPIICFDAGRVYFFKSSISLHHSQTGLHAVY